MLVECKNKIVMDDVQINVATCANFLKKPGLMSIDSLTALHRWRIQDDGGSVLIWIDLTKKFTLMVRLVFIAKNMANKTYNITRKQVMGDHLISYWWSHDKSWVTHYFEPWQLNAVIQLPRLLSLEWHAWTGNKEHKSIAFYLYWHSTGLSMAEQLSAFWTKQMVCAKTNGIRLSIIAFIYKTEPQISQMQIGLDALMHPLCTSLST